MFDNPFTVLKLATKIMKLISDHIPWWVILLIGLGIAVFIPILV